ncbi:MAG TPA: hypothetical protein VGM39_16975, partial [Kofleriaceae bacterium]
LAHFAGAHARGCDLDLRPVAPHLSAGTSFVQFRPTARHVAAEVAHLELRASLVMSPLGT